jgi:hypothetical protein
MNPMRTPRHPTVLSVGTHMSPLDGTCLMEAVSQAAGRPWSDTPACTHPLLGHLARLVNDTLGEQSRQQLLGYVPALAAASNEDPATYPRLALACTELALHHRPSPWLSHLHHAAARQLRQPTRTAASTGSVSAAWRRLYQRGPAARAIEASVTALGRLPGSARDAVLLELLELGIHTVVPRRPAYPTNGSLTPRQAHILAAG